MRSISSALQAEFDKPVTRVGYLLSISTSPVLQWCDLGTVTWDSKVWAEYSFSIAGAGGQEATLSVQNLDNAAGAAFMAADMSAVVVDVWQVAPAALALADVVRIGRYMFDGDFEIGLSRLAAKLVAENSLDAFSPRRRVDPANGFFYALPEGAKIAWENEIYINGAERPAGA